VPSSTRAPGGTVSGDCQSGESESGESESGESESGESAAREPPARSRSRPVPRRSGSAHPLTMPTATCPRTRPASSSTARRALATASRAARANGSTADPASVSRTERPERSSSCCPSSDSSRRTCALTPGWATCTRVAARVKLASSATTTKLLSHFRSMELPASMRRWSVSSIATSPHRHDSRSGITEQGR